LPARTSNEHSRVKPLWPLNLVLGRCRSTSRSLDCTLTMPSAGQLIGDKCAFDNSTITKLGPRPGPACDQRPLGLIRVGITVLIRCALGAIEFAD
jgi:hypothetical protein